MYEYISKVQYSFKVKPAIGQTARHCCHVSPQALASVAMFLAALPPPRDI